MKPFHQQRKLKKQRKCFIKKMWKPTCPKISRQRELRSVTQFTGEKKSIYQKLNFSSISVLPISLSEGSGNEINQLHQWFCFETKSCPFKYRKISAKVLKSRAMHWIFQITSRTQPTNIAIPLHLGFSTLCLGKRCVVILIKNLYPALVHFEKGK